MPNGHQKFISKPEIRFWIPIVIYTISLTMAFMSLKSDIKNLTTIVKFYTIKTDNLRIAINSTIQCTIRLDTENICDIK